MATQEKTWNVANRLHSQKDSDNPEVNHIIAGADEIYDDEKGAKQSDINAQADAALADRYTKAETYSKEQLDALITTPDVNYVTVATFADLPQTGEADTIYRVSFYDGTQVDASKYALYAWNGATYQLLAVRSAVGEVFDVSEYNSGATYQTLTAALAAVPATSKRGGMSIKFILRTNTGTEEEPVYKDEYVQYRLMAAAWSNDDADWQGVDSELVAGSKNLAESGVVYELVNGKKEVQTPLSYGFGGSNIIASGTETFIHITINTQFCLVFYEVEAGTSYHISVENTRNGRAWGWCDNILTETPIEETNLGGLVSTDSTPNGGTYEKTVTNTDYQYIVIAYKGGTSIPTLEKIISSDIVLYKQQYNKSESDKETARNNIGAASAERMNNISEEVDSTTAEVARINAILDYELSSQDIIQPSTTVAGIIPQSTSYLANSGMVTDYIFVRANTHIKVNGKARYAGFSLDVPAFGVPVLWYKHFALSSEANAYDYIFEQDGYLGMGRGADVETESFTLVNNGVKKTVEEIAEIGITEESILFPNYVYSVYNVGNPYRNVVQKIWFEGILRIRGKNLSINGGRCLNLVSYTAPTNSTSSVVKDIEMQGVAGTVKAGQFSLVTTKNNVIIGKSIKHLAIGDSWTAQNNLSMDGKSEGPWNYAAVVMEEFIRAGIDLEDSSARMIQLGRNSSRRRNGHYKEQEYYIRSSAEGNGGWSAYSYLRFACHVRVESNGTMSEKLAWDALGLGRKQVYGGVYDETAAYTEYVPGPEDRVKYLTEVAMGYYHWDYSTELLNYAGVTGTYTGTAEQKAAIDAKMENLLNNPDNPFYDWETARNTNGAYAFSLAKYLERYKTLEDDGVTRLIVGSTAGTEITSTYINRYDICKPTHVTIELGMNDYRAISIQQRFADIAALCTAIHAYDSNINVGIVTVHGTGSFYPELFTDMISADKKSDNEIEYQALLFDLNKAVMEAYPSKDGTNNVYYIPSYSTQGFTMLGGKNGITNDGHTIIIDGTDPIHPAMNVCYDIGQQIWAWILYTLV